MNEKRKVLTLNYGENEEKKIPFLNNMQFIIYKVHQEDKIMINEMIENIYGEVYFINYKLYTIAFSSSFHDIKDMFQTFVIDLEYEVYVHEGFIISSQTVGNDVIEYIDYYIFCNINKPYSSYIDICIKANNVDKDIIRIVSDNLFYIIGKYNDLINLMDAFFKNDLNVSQTSKLIYMHRNSLINKLEKIEKITGFNIQLFNNAFVMKLLLDFKRGVKL